MQTNTITSMVKRPKVRRSHARLFLPCSTDRMSQTILEMDSADTLTTFEGGPP